MKMQAIDKALQGLADKEKGKAKNVSTSELQKGVKVEKEHTQHPEIAKQIAKDHLVEIPDYYTRLHKMEQTAKKACGHMSVDQVTPGESQHDIETKGKSAKVSLSGDKIVPRRQGPWDTEGSPENVGETYKDLATKEAYFVGFQERCAAHGMTPDTLFRLAKDAMEHAMASPSPVAFKECKLPVKTDRKHVIERNEKKEQGDTDTVRRETQGKKEEAPDILTSRIQGNTLERSKG